MHIEPFFISKRKPTYIVSIAAVLYYGGVECNPGNTR